MPQLIVDVIADWNSEDIQNLGKLLDIKEEVTPERIATKLKWFYHSKTIASIEQNVLSVWDKLKKKTDSENDVEALREIPSYDELIIGACKQMDTYEENCTLKESELHLSLAVIIEALNKMKPKDRVDFFVKQIDLQKITNESNIKGESYTGVLTTVAALGLAQASGFGIFLASTTALGFLTHAVGITLPFAVYSGLGSTIAFVIGPAGWLAAGAFFSWKLTKAEWKKIIPALIYIISVNSRKCT